MLPPSVRRRQRPATHVPAARYRASLGFAVLIAVVADVGDAIAATIHVPADQPTIQAAVAAAASGDIVLVSPGTYVENIDIQGKAVTLQSASGPAVTVIDGNHAGAVVSMSNVPTGGAVIGFTLRNGVEGFYGSGISLFLASPLISGNVITANTGQNPGIGGFIASPTIQDNLFFANPCDNQFTSGVLGFVNGSRPVIHDNVIRDNDCRGINMTVPVDAVPVVFNNTIVRNRTGIYVDARVSNAAHTYRNNVIVANSIGLEVVFLVGAFDAAWRNNLFYGNTVNATGTPDPTGMNGNIDGDPRFVDAASNDLRLGPGSAAIDAGDATGLNVPPSDYAGAPRLADGNGDGLAAIDIGAFEAPVPFTPVPATPVPSLGPSATLLLALLLALAGMARVARKRPTREKRAP